jgi:asparagine synthase (glutamine-hydrolysing)
MCGIAGCVDAHGPVPVELLARMAGAVRHRGPDDDGIYRSPDGHAGLAFRRLAIIDLSPAGHQPMTVPGRDCWIVFNGEVYNFGELRAELEALGHAFRSRSDTEVVLHAWLEWGERCVERFIGMFAFAIWDEGTRVLFAARDRLGIKPLYYVAESDRLAFGSELKSLVAAGVPTAPLDADALADFLARGYISAPRTIYRGVRALLPGHTLTWREGAVTLRRYWDPLDYAIGPGSRVQADESHLADELDELLRSSIRYRLISDVPLGAFLSGGLDSTLVVALMRAVSGADVRTFTIGFPDARQSEAAAAAAVARHLGTTHLDLTATERDAQDVVPLLPDIFDEPFADASQIPTYLVSRLTREHVTVALSGDGGDELFGGYDNYTRLARIAPWWRAPRALRAAAALPARLLPHGTRRRALEGLAAADPLTYAEQVWRLFRRHEAAALVPALRGQFDDSEAGYAARRVAGSRMHRLEAMMLTDLERYLPNDILTKVDRASMAVSLEARVPLLDHRVVEFALGLPLEMRMRQGRTKVLLRRVLSRYVPPALTERPKRGFSVPLAAWLRGDLRSLTATSLAPERLAFFGVLDPAAVATRLARFARGGTGAEGIWALLMLQLWLERHHPEGRVQIA